ncbi:MAG: enoyl-CoA hydratase/isomerase family protein [Anaerolineae bacterium]
MSTTVEYDTLLFAVEDGVAHLTLNRPQAANALNSQMALDLFDAAVRCDQDPAVRAVLITGAGKLFSGGGDLREFATREDLAGHLKKLTYYFHAAMSCLARTDAPVIAAVNGTAGGAGMSLVCACDIVYAAESARFTMAYTNAGLTPDGSSTYFLPRIVGLKRALELALTNRRLSAQEALAFGIVSRVLPDDQVLGEATALAVQLAAGPTRAFGVTKRLLHAGMTESLETQMEREARGIIDISHTADAREGIAAFLEKRRPAFKGE